MKGGKNSNAAGNAILAFTALVWGIAFAFQRSGMDHIGPLVFNGVRMGLAALALTAVSAVVFGPKKTFVMDRKTLKAGIICGIFMTFGNILQQVGLKYTTAGKAGFITALYIVLVPVIRTLFLRKRESLMTWIGIGVGALGLYLLCAEEGFSFSLGDLWVMGCALMFALQIIAIDRFVSDCSPVQISIIQFLVNCLVSLVLALFLERDVTSLSGILEARNAILYCGIISGAGGYTLQMVGQKLTEPTVASMIMSFESVFAAVGGWLLLKETMSLRELAGCCVMFAAVIVIQLGSRNRAE